MVNAKNGVKKKTVFDELQEKEAKEKKKVTQLMFDTAFMNKIK